MENKIHVSLASLMLKLIVPVFLLGLLIGCSNGGNGYGSNPTGPSGSNGPGANEVWMQNIAYDPSTLTVSVGTTVTWTNKDNVVHSVTSGTPGAPDGIFDSGSMANGTTFSYTFNTAGTHPYYCVPHSSTMTGQVIVQ